MPIPHGRGGRPSRIFRWGCRAGVLAGLVLVGAIQMRSGSRIAADKAYWRVAGPACQSATLSDLARIGRPVDQSFDFEIAKFDRISGAAFCSGLTEGKPFAKVHSDVCQFNSPRALVVSARGQRRAFQIGGGRPATVKVAQGGKIDCVEAARFKGD